MTRTLQWLFLVSVLLFVSGIGFVIAAGRTVRAAPASAGAAATTAVPPVATVKQVMRGITMPAAATIWDSVSTIVDSKGVTENVPKNDAEWAVVGANAAVLAESANMLMTGDRAIDKADWIKFATALRDSAKTALKAADAKDAAGILAVGEVINASCDACHERYQRN
jgi:cytochrome c556